jgi:hypothetical protein
MDLPFHHIRVFGLAGPKDKEIWSDVFPGQVVDFSDPGHCVDDYKEIPPLFLVGFF